VPDDSTALTENLQRLADRDRYRADAETLGDLHLKTGVLRTGGITRLSQVAAVSRELDQAEVVLTEELEQVRLLLGNVRLPPNVDEDTARARLLSTECPLRDQLIRDVQALSGRVGIREPSLLHDCARLRTRMALLALREALARFDRIQRGAGPLYLWVRKVVRGDRDGLEPVPQNPTELSPDEQHAIEEELNAFEQQIEILDRLPRGRLPRWRGQRDSDHKLAEDRIAQGCNAMRTWLHEQSQTEHRGGDSLRPLVERIQKLQPWLAARQVWSARVRRLKACKTIAEREPRRLLARCTGPPDEWEEVAAAIDRYCDEVARTPQVPATSVQTSPHKRPRDQGNEQPQVVSAVHTLPTPRGRTQ
jgi:hypothetical protein